MKKKEISQVIFSAQKNRAVLLVLLEYWPTLDTLYVSCARLVYVNCILHPTLEPGHGEK